MKQLLLLTCGIALLLNACTIEKRRYTSGYHVEWNHNGRYRKQAIPDSTDPQPVVTSALTEADYVGLPDKATEKNISLQSSFKPALADTTGDDECDILVMKSGERLICKVIEITSDEVKYKKCHHTSGPLYSVKKTDVDEAIYPNGEHDVMIFKASPDKPVGTGSDRSGTPPNQLPVKKTEPLAVASFLLALGIFIPYIGLLCIPASLICGFIAISRINKNPETKKGIGFAIAGVVIALLILLLLLFALLLFVALIGL